MSKPKFKLLREMAGAFAAALEGKSRKQLRLALKQCNEVTSTNCWWLTYRLADTAREVIEAQLDSMTWNKRHGLQPCGHPESEIESTDEGTSHCAACEREQV